MEKKQSSVEWFAEMVSKMGYVSVEILEQAKAMHKEEMCKFVYKCHNHYKVNGDFKIEEYYTKTFGGQDNE